ncbi:hypothetical protein [Vibrio sp. TRT 17S01]|uniref:hypothetical protein n=1 Tax=Vibrio sp. TRT 17S01 TaxID=3418505 RepID=UPI003CFA4447
MKNIKVFVASILAASTLMGCSTIEESAAKMVLGEKFVQANEALNHCDMSGIAYLKQEANSDNDFMASASALALGAHYASIGDTDNVNTMANILAKASAGKTSFSQAKKDLLEAGKSTGQDRINNGFTASCK